MQKCQLMCCVAAVHAMHDAYVDGDEEDGNSDCGVVGLVEKMMT